MAKTEERSYGLIISGAVCFVVLALVLYGLGVALKQSDVPSEVGLPVLAIAGLIALITALALVAIAFSMMSLSDKTQALGLPNGSVRAVIALSLVVLFAILSVFLFSALNGDGKVKKFACLSGTERDGLLEKIPPADILLSTPSSLTAAGVLCPGAPAAGPPTLYQVIVRDTLNPASSDFAKQLLVLIGTLVTSVAGFYFGSKAVADATDGGGSGPPPSLTGVDPGKVQGGGSVSLKITGSNLNQVVNATIATGSTQLTDPGVVSNTGQVLAKFVLPADAPTGAWDVSVVDSAGRSARLAGALTVAPPGPSQTPAAPQPQTDPASGGTAAADLAKQATAIRTLAIGMQSRLDTLLGKSPLQSLVDAAAKLGGGSQALSSQLTTAQQALGTMKARIAAGMTDADRADAAVKDTASADPTVIQASADRLNRLNQDAAQASHDFDQAYAAYDQASRAIFASTASG